MAAQRSPAICLGFLVVIHQDQLLTLQIQQIPPGYHADIVLVLIQYGEITVALLAHDLLDILGLFIHMEFCQML